MTPERAAITRELVKAVQAERHAQQMRQKNLRVFAEKFKGKEAESYLKSWEEVWERAEFHTWDVFKATELNRQGIT